MIVRKGDRGHLILPKWKKALREVTLGQVAGAERVDPSSPLSPSPSSLLFRQVNGRQSRIIIRADYRFERCVRTSGGGSRTIMDNGPGNRHRKQHKFSSPSLGQSRLTGHLRAPSSFFFYKCNSTLCLRCFSSTTTVVPSPVKSLRPPWTRACKSIILNKSRSATRSSSESPLSSIESLFKVGQIFSFVATLSR